MRDTHTNIPDAAAAHERWHHEPEPDPDVPTLLEAERDDMPNRT